MTTGRSWKRFTSSRFTTSPGARFRRNTASGTASGSGFCRLSRSGVFEAFFQLLAETSKTAHLVQMFDSTVVRAHVSAAGAKGGSKSGARAPAWRLLVQDPPQDGLRRLAHRLPSDRRRGEPTLAAATSYRLHSRPPRSNAKHRPVFFPKLLYKTRARIEQAVGKLKRFKRVALRCEKTTESYAALVALACGLILVKSVHRD